LKIFAPLKRGCREATGDFVVSLFKGRCPKDRGIFKISRPSATPAEAGQALFKKRENI